MGSGCKHRMNGFYGYVVAISESLNGTVQCALKSEKLDTNNQPTDDRWWDIAMLEKCDGGDHGVPVEEPAKTGLKLGDEVRHFSGFTGVAIEHVVYMNGCRYFGVMPKTDDPSKMPEIQYIPCQYLEKLDTKPVKTQSDPVGGPPTKAPII